MRKLWQREKGLLRGFTLSELMVMMAASAFWRPSRLRSMLMPRLVPV